MTLAQWLGLVLAVWGAAGMWVAGRGRWAGWAMGLAVQPVWAVFAVVVHSWPLLISPALYGSVYARNLWRWSRLTLVLYGRKVPGTPYGGEWQARRSGRVRDLWATWREERGSRREFDGWRLRLRRVSADGLTLERLA